MIANRKRAMVSLVAAAGLAISVAGCGSSEAEQNDSNDENTEESVEDNDSENGENQENGEEDNGDDQENGEDDDLGFELKEEKWKLALGDGGALGSPAVYGEAIYVGGAGVFGSGLFAVDLQGNQLGQFEDGSYPSTPAIDENGIVYAKSTDGILRAFDPDGAVHGLGDEPIWSFDTDIEGDEVSIDSISSPAIGSDGLIYLVSVDEHVYALAPQEDGSDPRIEWSFEMDLEGTYEEWGRPSSPTVGADGTVYAGGSIHGGEGSKLYALTPPTEGENGQEQWSIAFDGSFQGNPAMDAEQGLFVVTDTDVKRVDTSDGNPENSIVELGDNSLVQMSPARGFNTPISEDGLAFVGTRATGNLRALDSTIEDDNREAWTFRPDHARDIVTTPVLDDDGMVYVASDGTSNFDDDRHFLYAVDLERGKADWAVELDDPVHASDPVLFEGVIYVGTGGGDLYAIEADGDAPAASEWPMYGRNHQRTSSMH